MNKKRNITNILIIPSIISIIFIFVSAILIYKIAATNFKESYINNLVSYSNIQADIVVENNKIYKFHVNELEEKLYEAANIALLDKDNLSNERLEEIKNIFNGLHSLCYHDKDGKLLYNSDNYSKDYTPTKGDPIDTFIKSNKNYHYEYKRAIEEDNDYYLYYQKDELGNFIQSTILADTITQLIDEHSYKRVVERMVSDDENILSSAIVNDDFQILAISHERGIEFKETDKTFYNKAFNGETVYREKHSKNLNLNVLEIISPINLDDENIVISTLFSLEFTNTINNQLITVVFVLSLLIIFFTFTVLNVYIIQPIAELSKTIESFDPFTAKYKKPSSQKVVFKGVYESIDNLSKYIKDANNERDKLNNTLYNQSIKDELTSLYNRRHLINKIDNEIITNNPFSLIFIDIDNFKNVNDSKGHIVGDEILIYSAKILKTFTNKYNNYVSRYGGDEFVILTDFVKEEDLSKFIKEIYYEFSKPFKHNESTFYINISIGISVYPKDGLTSIGLIRKADLAMYNAKNSGRNKFVFYIDQMDKEFQKEVIIKNKIVDAIKNDGFKILLQPQYDLHSNEIVSYEALARFKNYNIGPNKFIKIAEKYDYIDDLGLVIINKTLDTLKFMKDNNLKLKTIYVNFSVSQLKNKDLLSYIIKRLNEIEVEHKYFGVEITESMFIDNNENVLKFMEELTNKDFKVAIDDFGSGNSSIKYLLDYNIGLVKLDKSFKDNYLNEENLEIYTSIVDLAKRLNYEVLAEGIETKEEVELLKKTNCSFVQGYYYSKPKEIKEILKIDKNVK